MEQPTRFEEITETEEISLEALDAIAREIAKLIADLEAREAAQ